MASAKVWPVAIVGLVVALMVFPMTAQSALLNPITTENGGVIGGGNWESDVSLGWTIVGVTGGYLYSYSFEAPDPGSGSSHFILQTSGNFQKANIITISDSYVLGTFAGNSTSNPGMPGPLFGIDFEVTAEGADGNVVWDFSLVSDRAPMEGDFYAQGGESSYAYNSGFASGEGAKILVPDTDSVAAVPVPEPATLMLLGSGLLGLAFWGRKRFSN